MPNTFIYLFSFFLLADVCPTHAYTLLLLNPVTSNPDTGSEHDHDARCNMPEWQILFFVLTEHISWTCTGYHIDDEYAWILVYPEVLEDQYQENGRWERRWFAKIANLCGWQFIVTNVVTIMIPLWGMIGIWTDKLGWVTCLYGLSSNAHQGMFRPSEFSDFTMLGSSGIVFSSWLHLSAVLWCLYV